MGWQKELSACLRQVKFILDKVLKCKPHFPLV